MTLSNEEREIVVAYRLEKALKALEHAEGNARLEYWEVTANRLYYAAYYAVSALLLQEGYSAQTHNGTIQLFGRHFVKTGIVSKESGRLYSQLFSIRITGDYSDSFGLTREDVEPLIGKTKSFVGDLQALLKR